MVDTDSKSFKDAVVVEAENFFVQHMPKTVAPELSAALREVVVAAYVVGFRNGLKASLTTANALLGELNGH